MTTLENTNNKSNTFW